MFNYCHYQVDIILVNARNRKAGNLSVNGVLVLFYQHIVLNYSGINQSINQHGHVMDNSFTSSDSQYHMV